MHSWLKGLFFIYCSGFGLLIFGRWWAIGLQLWVVVVVPCFILGVALVRVAKFCFVVYCLGKYLFWLIDVGQILVLWWWRGCLPVLLFIGQIWGVSVAWEVWCLGWFTAYQFILPLVIIHL